jgi:hypothetical protein
VANHAAIAQHHELPDARAERQVREVAQRLALERCRLRGSCVEARSGWD